MTYETKTVVAIAALMIDEFGYRKDFGTNSLDNTKAYVRIMYNGLFGELRDIREKELYDEKLAPLVAKSQAYNEKADKILDWIRNYDTTNVTNKSEFFMAKMKRAVKSETVDIRDLGYVACLPNSYNKQVEPKTPKVSPVTGKPKVEVPPKVVEPPKPVEPVKPIEPIVEKPKVEPVVEKPKETSAETIEVDGMTFGNKAGFMPSPSWMEKKYRVFNTKYFEDKLPLNIKFELSKKATRWAGLATAKGRYVNGKVEWVANAIKLAVVGLHTEKHTCEILLHEMIHIWQYAVEKTKGGHGWDFHQEMRRINKFGWNVEAKESYENQMLDAENPEIIRDFERLKMLVISRDKRDIYRFSIIAKSSLIKFKNYAKMCINSDIMKTVDFYTFKDAKDFYKRYSTTSIKSGLNGYRRTKDGIKEILDKGVLKLETHMGKELFEESTFEEIYRLSEAVTEKDDETPIAKVGEMFVTDCKKIDDGYEFECFTV